MALRTCRHSGIERAATTHETPAVSNGESACALLHWRLLTQHVIAETAQAWQIIE